MKAYCSKGKDVDCANSEIRAYEGAHRVDFGSRQEKRPAARQQVGSWYCIAKCCRELSPIGPGVRGTKQVRLRPRCVGLGLRFRCLNRNKIYQPVCVERSVRVDTAVAREVGTRVHGRSDAKGPLNVTRAQTWNGKTWLRETITHNVKVCVS